MITFPCPKCAREFTVDNALAGQSGSCSWCGAAMKIPQPYADGTRTDERRDPALQPMATGGGHNPFQLPQYRDGPPPANLPRGEGGNQLLIWVVVGIFIILLNIVLVPLTGYAIIPR